MLEGFGHWAESAMIIEAVSIAKCRLLLLTEGLGH